MREFGDPDGAERSVLGRLDHERVAHRKRRPRDAGEDLQRVVPWNDARDHSVRFAQCQRGVAGKEGNRVSVNLVAGSAVELVIAHGRDHVGLALADRLARVARFERGKLLAMLLDQLIEPG